MSGKISALIAIVSFVCLPLHPTFAAVQDVAVNTFVDSTTDDGFNFVNDVVLTISGDTIVNHAYAHTPGITTATNGTGSIVFSQDPSQTGKIYHGIGTTTHRIKSLVVEDTGTWDETAVVYGDIFINQTTVGAAALEYWGSLERTWTGDVAFTENAGTTGLFFLGERANFTGNVTTADNNEGSFDIQGTSIIVGNLGTSGASLYQVTVGDLEDGKVVSMTGDIHAATVNFVKDNTLNMTDGYGITGNVTTTVNHQGALTLEGGSQTVSGTVGTLSNALKTVNAGADSATSTFGGAVHALALNIMGTGTVSLNANSNIATTTLAGAGTLALNAMLAGSIDNGGHLLTITNDGVHSGTVKGVISGLGGLSKTGDGTLTLSGANTFEGGTTLSAGTLNINNTDALGTGRFTINGGTIDNTAGAALTLATHNAQTWAGDFVFSGTNNLNLGTGTVTLGGNREVAVNAYELTVGGIIEGGFGLTKTGAGTLALNGANTYTGTTNINAGTLAARNTSALGTGNVMNHATLDIGTTALQIGGDYTQGVDGRLALTLNSATADDCGNMVVSGAAGIAAGSVVHVVVPSGVTPASETQFTIVMDSNGATDIHLPEVTSSNRRHKFIPHIDGITGSLILTSANGSYVPAAGASGAALAVGSVFDHVVNSTGDMKNVMDRLSELSDAEYASALETMAPDMSSGTMQASQATANQFLGTVSSRLGGMRSGLSGIAAGDLLKGVGFWIQELGSNIHQGERKGTQGFNANLFGTSLGVDRLVDDHVRVGLSGGYGFSKVNAKTPGSPSDTIHSWQATVYASYDSVDLNKQSKNRKGSKGGVRERRENSWYVDGMFGFTENNYDSRREIWLTPSTKRVAKAEHYGQQYSTKAETGYTFVFEQTKALETTPFASLQYSYLRMNKYKEDGADALNLTVNGNGYNQLLQALGTKFAYPFQCKKAGTFLPSVKAAWLYDYIGDQVETTAAFAGGGSSFTTRGAKPAKSGLLLGGELAFLNKGNLTLTANYDLELKDAYTSNTYYATARLDF